MDMVLNNFMAILVLIALAGAFAGLVKVLRYAKENTKSDEVKKVIGILEKIVSNSVVAANQTFVDELKKENKFDKQAQEDIFNDVKVKVIQQLNEDSKKILNETIKNTDLFINEMIEKEVNKNK